MKMKEFKKYLESLESIETQIVYIRYKYSWEKNWIYSNEILEVDMNADGYYAWTNDWYEGQEDIEILGCIALYDIYVPKFQKDTEDNGKSNSIDRQNRTIDDCIRRQKAIKALYDYWSDFSFDSGWCDIAEMCEAVLNELPAEPVDDEEESE